MDGQFFPGQAVQFDGPTYVPRNPWLRRDFKEIIDGLGIGSGLKLCLDAGDAASYASGQSWRDLSGGGYDFLRGTTSGAQASDPTFNGASGGLSSAEYWSFDGGDQFRYDSANETWMQNIHKNNALFTLAAWFYLPDLGGFQALWGTCSNASLSNIGAQWIVDTYGNLYLQVLNGSASSAAVIVGSVVSAGAWKFAALSVNEAAGTAVGLVNTTRLTPASVYTSPSASNASFTAEIAASGNADARLRSGARMAGFMAWEGVSLSANDLDRLFVATRGRFGV